MKHNYTLTAKDPKQQIWGGSRGVYSLGSVDAQSVDPQSVDPQRQMGQVTGNRSGVPLWGSIHSRVDSFGGRLIRGATHSGGNSLQQPISDLEAAHACP